MPRVAFLVRLAGPLLAVPLAAQQTPTFANLTAELALPAVDGEPMLAFGDYDADGDPDLLVAGRRLLRNDSDAERIALVDVTEAVGLGKARGPSGCWFDFDLDGRLDIGTSGGEVWIQDGKGAFRDFTQPLGIAVPHGTAAAIAWGDVDGDGWLDLVTGGDTRYDPLEHFAQSCWLNRPRRVPLARLAARELARLEPMRDASAAAGIRELRYGRAIVFCDYDWDGDQDVYSGNYHLAANNLFRNENGVFTDVGGAACVTGRHDETMFTDPRSGQKVGYRWGHTIGATWADLDNDGYFDLWVSNLVHKFAGELPDGRFDVRGWLCDDSNLFLNSGPPDYTFRDARAELGIPVRPIGDLQRFRGDELWSNAAIGDVDNNGFVDTFVNQVYGHIDYSFGLLFVNDGGRYREVHREAGIAVWGGYGGAFADLDSDGQIDLAVAGAPAAKGQSQLNVYRNTTAAGPWIGFHLIEQKGVLCTGAKVLLIQQDGVQLRQLATTMGSHGQSNEGRVHFGLGSGGALRDVVIYWPGGRLQALRAPAPGRYHEVRRPAGRGRTVQLAGPERAQAGVAVAFTATDLGPDWTYYWDFAGGRRAECITTAPAVDFAFAAPGLHVVCLLAVHPRAGAAEGRISIAVSAP
jgi:hypothetical protein